MSDKDSNKEHQYKINHSIADPNQEAATPAPKFPIKFIRREFLNPLIKEAKFFALSSVSFSPINSSNVYINIFLTYNSKSTR